MNYADLNIDIPNGRLSGEVQTKCPKCSQDRKKKNDKCLSVNLDLKVWLCHHCGWKGSLQTKNYALPVWENKTTLSNNVVEWFSRRGISQDTLIKMKVTNDKGFMPQAGEERSVICFNYFKDGVLTNIKYRDKDKNFKLYKDAELIFYNLDCIKKQEELIIVEGEIDCLTMVQLGYDNCISVPNGANKGNNNLQYLDNCYQYFENVKSVIIATDNDEPGEKLGQELARRIGVEKCKRAKLGKFKDVNECYTKTGKVDFESVDPYPIEGIFGVNQHWDGLMDIRKNGFPKGWSVRGALKNIIQIHPGYTTMITGIPGHGKSEFLDQLVIQLCIDHDLKGAFFSPENRPTELHIIKLIEKITGRNFWKTNDFSKAKDFLEDRFFWVYPEEGYNLDNILDKVRQAVLRHGVSWYVIDPWNKLEHQYTETETKYVSESLDKIANFNHKNGTHCFIVAHPTKMRFNHDTGKYEIPGLYDISGSANFYNKTDIGITAYKESDGVTGVYVQKVKFKYWGSPGKVEYKWNQENGRYDEYGLDLNSWLEEKAKQEPLYFNESQDDEVPF
jgi:twinkle protein